MYQRLFKIIALEDKAFKLNLKLQTLSYYSMPLRQNILTATYAPTYYDFRPTAYKYMYVGHGLLLMFFDYHFRIRIAYW